MQRADAVRVRCDVWSPPPATSPALADSVPSPSSQHKRQVGPPPPHGVPRRGRGLSGGHAPQIGLRPFRWCHDACPGPARDPPAQYRHPGACARQRDGPIRPNALRPEAGYRGPFWWAHVNGRPSAPPFAPQGAPAQSPKRPCTAQPVPMVLFPAPCLG